MEVNPATTSTLKRSAFHIREFPRFTVGHFLVVKLTTVRRGRGKPPKKNHITGTPSQKKMWPPQKKSLENGEVIYLSGRNPGNPAVRFFGFSGFQWDFFRGGGAVFGLQEAAKNDAGGWRFVPWLPAQFWGKNCLFWKVGGSNLSKNADTLYNQMMAWQ